MVPPAVSAKCAWLIGNGITEAQKFAEFFQKNHAGEITTKNTKK